MSKNDLVIDWASFKASKLACQKWHYSKSIPAGKLVKIGVWEYGKFIGVVLYGRGANCNMLKPFNLKQNQGCELVRVALTKHENKVSRIMSLAMKFLIKENRNLRLIISYADAEQGHHGGIYQANGWIYSGLSAKATKVFYKGKWSHKKTVDDSGVDQSNLIKKIIAGKHRYLMPLDKEMRTQIESISKPYPKRTKLGDGCDQQNSGGATPTCTLHSTELNKEEVM